MSRPVRLGEPLAELRRTDPPVQRLAGLVAREDVQVEHDPASKRDTFPHAHRRCGRRYLFTVVCGKVSLMPLSNTSFSFAFKEAPTQHTVAVGPE